MKLISSNYAQMSSTVVGASSESVYFPASNIKHEFRSKEWRSSVNGYYKVTTKTEISFTDSDLTSHVVNINTGEYDALELATEIQNKLESVTAQIFNVYKSETTGLWTIESEELFSLNNVDSDSFLPEYCGFESSVYTSSLSQTGSKIAIHSEEFLTFDLRTTEEIDSVILLWDKGNIRLSPDASISVEANPTNNWTSPAFSQELNLNETFEIASLYLDTPESYRYWRIKIVDPENPYLYVSLGVLILGQAEATQNPDNGFTWSIVDNSNVTVNDFGNTWVDELPQLNTLSINFSYLDYEIAQVLEVMYKRVGNRLPVFIALETTGEVFNKDNYSIYGKFGSSFGLNHIMFKYLSSSLNITEVL